MDCDGIFGGDIEGENGVVFWKKRYIGVWEIWVYSCIGKLYSCNNEYNCT